MRTQRQIKFWLVLWFLLGPACLWGQIRNEIRIPDIPGYQTLMCDFHMHTVFSDGKVWPTVRVEEAWRQGLDAIAITDHIEHQPHKKDIPTQHNRPHQIAAGMAANRNILFPLGAEITRKSPPGHFNAIFLQDVNPLDTEDFLTCIERANAQGAFVFWNHPNRLEKKKGKGDDVHATMYEKKWLHGMEVCNGGTYYSHTHQLCLDKNLTMIGNSDIHHPDLRTKSLPDDHRTMTLVFVTARTMKGLKEALQAGRTAVWYGTQIIGRTEYLEPLFRASVTVSPGYQRHKNSVRCTITNQSDIPIELQRKGDSGPKTIHLPPYTTRTMKVHVKSETDKSVSLSYEVTNYRIAPETSLPVTLTIELPK